MCSEYEIDKWFHITMADIIKWNGKKELFRSLSSFCCSHEVNQKKGLPHFNTPPEIVKSIAIYRLNVIKSLLFLSKMNANWIALKAVGRRRSEERRSTRECKREEGKEKLTCSSECKSFRSMSVAFSFNVLTATVVTPSLPAKQNNRKKNIKRMNEK